ncbi:MAG: UDP-N-acetylmuramoyl-tripeptide--D-alanyl-D-alanine ligase [Actinomycetota bacterium]
MRFTAGDVARATDGALVGDDVDIDGASIDSRTRAPSQLFVPIVGERDGHDFIDPSAGPYLTAHEPVGGTAVHVAETGRALLDLGSWARRRLGDRVVGITGSVGKTTVKDLLAAILRQRFVTAASPGNFNNELGLPLTLLNAPDGANAGVLEMGARGIGHIAMLCEVGRPTIGVVTAVAAVHTEVFGTIDDVARGKSELVAALPKSGTAVLNGDDVRCATMASVTDARVLTYSVEGTGDLTADGVHFDDELRPTFVARTPWGDVEVRVGVRGVHQVGNALAAAGAALAAGATLDDVAAGLVQVEMSRWRMELARAASGLLVLNDAYNASPTSVIAALQSLAAFDARRRIAFLGTMAELDDPLAAHREVADAAASLGIQIVAVAEPRYGGELVDDIDAAVELATLLQLGDGDAVLVKGSRVAGLERLAERLLA